MATRVRCLKCFKIIECAPYDTSILLKHIKTDHPEIVLPDDDTMDSENPDTAFTRTRNSNGQQRTSRVQLPPMGDDMEEETIRSPGRKPMYTRKYKVHSPRTPRSPQKRHMYKTSIEKWRPAKGTIYCPKCGTNRRPIIRTRSEKLSYSTVGAACILTCWPLCFLPCFFPSPSKDYLHCAECNNFLGMYDKQNNCVRPNREFVERGSCTGSDKSLEKTPEKPQEKPQEKAPEKPQEKPQERPQDDMDEDEKEFLAILEGRKSLP